MSNDVCWCLVGSDGVCECLIMSEVVRRLCEEFLKADLSAVYGRLYGFGASKDVFEFSGLLWCSKCYTSEFLNSSNRQN